MKQLLAVCLIATTTLAFSQAKENTVSQFNNNIQVIASNPVANQNLGSFTYYNPKFDREGTVYLFDDWYNNGLVFPKGSDNFYTANNINFNIQRSMFETRKGDSLASYNFSTLKKIVIGGKTFKSFYYEPIERNRVFEVIFESEDFSLLKNYKIEILPANPNPMIARMRDKILQKHDYYIETPETLTKFTLRKRKLLQVMGDNALEAERFAKENRLSFKKEADLKLILGHIYSK